MNGFSVGRTVDRDDRMRQVLLPVKNEAAAVVAEMRQNAKWAAGAGSLTLAPGQVDGGDTLLGALLRLRLANDIWTDPALTPLTFLQPFLSIIVDAEASGPITAAALVAVRNILHSPVLPCFPPPEVQHAMHAVVSALTMCKFEATNPWHDQMVLCKILHTLEACLECASGRLLTDNDVCAIFQAVYRIGFDTQVVAELSELLVNLVKDSLSKMVRIIFAHILHAAPDGDSLDSVSGTGDGSSNASAQSQGAVPREGGAVGPTGPDHSRRPPPGGGVMLEDRDDNSSVSDGGYGVQCGVHILQFLVKLIEIEALGHFALDLLRTLIIASGPRLAYCPEILTRCQIDMLIAMLRVFRGTPGLNSPGGVATGGDAAGAGKVPRNTILQMSQVMLVLYQQLRRYCLLQVDIFLQCVILPLAKGRLLRDNRGHTPATFVEAGYEVLLDFCLTPGFLQDAYASLDCRLECSNLFEDILKVLTRATQPRTGGRGVIAMNALALKGLLATLSSLSDVEMRPESLLVPPACLLSCKARDDLWHAIVRGQEPDCEGLMAQLAQEPLPTSREGEDEEEQAWQDVCSIRRLQWEKMLKGRLESAIEIFNEDYKKGFQFLQVNRLLPDPMDSKSVAALLRFGRGIDRQIVGNFMGKGEDFHQEVMGAYVRTFPFEHLSLDTAFRAFADTFKQPPESQQVVRFTKNFVQAFLKAHGGDYRGFRTFKCLNDFITVCLWHNSTWYNANPSVPKMTSHRMFADAMSESVTEHDAPDEEVFAQMYSSICDTAFPQANNDPYSVDLPAARLALVAERSATRRGQAASLPRLSYLLHRDMFLLVWAPAVRATAVLLESTHPDDARTISDGMRAMRRAAAVAKQNFVEGAVDTIIATLATFTLVADPTLPMGQATVAFVSSRLALAATETMFEIATDYADMMRSGWATVLDCIMRLHKMRLVEPSVFFDSSSEEGDMAFSRLAAAPEGAAVPNTALFGFFFTSSPPPPTELTPAERAAEADARAFVSRCRIDALFDDSKFLGPDSLHALVSAVSTGAGAGSGGEGSREAIDTDPEVAEASLELLIKLAIRNRDRIHLLLPLLNGQVRRIVLATAEGTAALTQRAVCGVLRVCRRLLKYRPDMEEQLIDCLKAVLLLDMSPSTEPYKYNLAPTVARALVALIKGCAQHLHSQPAWDVLLRLLHNSCNHPGSIPAAAEALDWICRDPGCLAPANFMEAVAGVRGLVGKASGMLGSLQKSPEGFGLEDVRRIVSLLEAVAQWLQTWRQKQAQASALPDGDLQQRRWLAELSSFWHHLLEAIAAACVDWHPDVRSHALVMLHKVLTLTVEHLHLSPETWGTTWREVILPMLAEMASAMQEQSLSREDTAPLARTICLAVNVMHKTFAAHITELGELREWRPLWLSTLQGLKSCTSTTDAAASAEVRAAVMQAVAGMIQAMHSRKMLSAHARDREGLNLWDRTFSLAFEVSSDLTPKNVLGVS